MKPHISTGIFALLSLVLGILLFRAERNITRLEAEQNERDKRTAESPVDHMGKTVADKTKQAETDPVIIQAKKDTPPADTATMDNALRNQQRIMTSMANMRENPTINKMIEASQRGTIGALYEDMLDYLNLSPDETKYFMDLLMYRQMEQVDFGMKLMSGQLTEEKREQMAVHLAEVHKEMLAQMKTFLNSTEDYEEFRFYEKTIGERMALSQLDQKLAELDQPLSDDAYRNLLDVMHRERESYPWSTDLHEEHSTDVSAQRFSEENMKKHTDDIMLLNESIYAQASRLLTPEQFQAFKTSLQATTDMQLAQFLMVGQLLRDQKN